MAGFSKIFCIGNEGGFMGADGANRIHLQIWVGDAHRQWLEPHYFGVDREPVGNISRIIPKGPDHRDSLIDACIAFIPELFRGCPTLAVVEKSLANNKLIDFDSEGEPTGWAQLREEAREKFGQLHIWEARLEKLQPRG